ncbi:hypothetical protein HanIR_Chr15g0779711 [Helianthus annuus]|nr:hypothetical protein HanIR_Chr15g0779711 [Helianthus annuus]
MAQRHRLHSSDAIQGPVQPSFTRLFFSLDPFLPFHQLILTHQN